MHETKTKQALHCLPNPSGSPQKSIFCIFLNERKEFCGICQYETQTLFWLWHLRFTNNDTWQNRYTNNKAYAWTKALTQAQSGFCVISAVVAKVKVGDWRVMTLKPVVLRVPITELPTVVERKSKQTALNDRPEPMSLPIKWPIWAKVGD